MSDSLKLYRTIAELMLKSQVRFHDKRCFVTFIWAIVCVILEKSVNISKWIGHRVSSAQAASKERQFIRWLENTKIQNAVIYKKLAQTALADWEDKIIYLALDTSSLWNKFVIVRLALIYRGRALPLSWLVLDHKSTSVAFEVYKPILKEAAALLPKNRQVILLADRGFADLNLMKRARDLGWGFRIRLKKSFRVHRAHKPSTKIGRLIPAKGQAFFLHKVWLTDQYFGPVYLALAHVKTPNGYQEWAIVSDAPTDLQTFDEYGLRFDLEENFLDDKSGGFLLESSQIRSAQMLSRLGLVLATATLYLISLGTVVVDLDLRRLVDTHWNRGLSYFKIGLRWIQFALNHSEWLLPFFWFGSSVDPFPVFASKRQAVIPIATFFQLRQELY
jgi:hypothetical protein